MCPVISAMSFLAMTQRCWKIPFQNFSKEGEKLSDNSDATAKNSQDNREIICDFCLISLCSIIVKNTLMRHIWNYCVMYLITSVQKYKVINLLCFIPVYKYVSI